MKGTYRSLPQNGENMEPFRNSKTLVLWLLIFCACFSAATPAQAKIKKTRPMFVLVSAKNCSSDMDSLNSYTREVKITKQSRDVVVINLEIVVKRDYTNPQTVVDASKCTDRDGSQCEYFMHIPLSACFFFDAKNQFWSPIFDSIHPRLNCTYIKTGVYKMINGTVDTTRMMDMMNSMPNLDYVNYYWKYKIAMVSKKKQEFCGEFLLKIDYIKS